MQSDTEAIVKILLVRGHEQYDQEFVSQLEHALQCATLAETATSSNKLITACLPHDLGHLLHNLGEDAVIRGVDDFHEYRALHFLQQLFDDAVTEPIRLHVNAKRYLCTVDLDYWKSLSSASKRSLELQGGIFSSEEAEIFVAQPHAKEAVQLRRWDDRAKVPGLQTPDLAYFVPILTSCLL